MAKSNGVKISKIELKIGDKTISLSPEEAKELNKMLSDLFGTNPAIVKEIIYHEHYPLHPWPYVYWSTHYVDNGTITVASTWDRNVTNTTTDYKLIAK